MARTNKKDSLSLKGVQITHPEKVMFKDPKISKGELAGYYGFIAERMLKEVSGRPLMLSRCPAGESYRCFFQKHHKGKLPYPTVKIKEGDSSARENYAFVESAKDIMALVQLNSVEFHAWGSKVPDIEKPDRIIFDIDPDSEISAKVVVKLALEIRDLLKRLKLKSFARISGGKGIHVVVPITPKYSWDEVKEYSRAIAVKFEESNPATTTNPLKSKRKGRIFIDYLRNSRGATAITNFSVRARKNAPIAVPLTWAELKKVKSFNFINLSNYKRELKKLNPDPWKGINRLKQELNI